MNEVVLERLIWKEIGKEGGEVFPLSQAAAGRGQRQSRAVHQGGGGGLTPKHDGQDVPALVLQ